MENKDKPIYPSESKIHTNGEFLEYEIPKGKYYPGLTKREMFAVAAMQGLLSNGGMVGAGLDKNNNLPHNVVKVSIAFADELLKQLES